MLQSKIKILPQDLVNKIAAGEVVERPASVVKELVENAIDAKSTEITIEIKGAGKKLIRISDNGVGMNHEELKLALERHSTSKISSLKDLNNISSLGFRGEALPAIASVSKIEIYSSDGNEGAVYNGEDIKKQGLPKGTTVLVKDLFYNTPARKKFLKRDSVELYHIVDIVSKFILGYSNISFKLVVDENERLASFGNGSLKDAIVSVFGHDISGKLIDVNFKEKDISISGFVSLPDISRSDRNMENFFVNGRFVKNYTLMKAFEITYQDLVPRGRYPFCVLFIEVPPTQVDVNVHPTKKEIKFVDSKKVFECVNKAASGFLSHLLAGKSENVLPGEGSGFSSTKWIPQMADALFSNIGTREDIQIADREFVVTDIEPLIYLYQLKNSYIVTTDGEDLIVIDQHAAQERIIYDKLKKKEFEANNLSQGMLIGENIDFSLTEIAILEKNKEILQSMGFDVQEFGKNSFILKSIPMFIKSDYAVDILRDVIQDLKEENVKGVGEYREKALKTVACKSAIKAGDKLNVDEVKQLIRDLYKTENPLTCPHGRPTMIRFKIEDFEKMFKRR